MARLLETEAQADIAPPPSSFTTTCVHSEMDDASFDHVVPARIDSPHLRRRVYD